MHSKHLRPDLPCSVFTISLLCLLYSFFSTNLCGSWTCWSASSPVWFCISYTLFCAPSAGTTLCLWALFSAATIMSFLNCCETELCWVKPTPTLCPPTAWGSSLSEGLYTVRSNRWTLLWMCTKDHRLDSVLWLWGLRDRLWTHSRVLIRFYFYCNVYINLFKKKRIFLFCILFWVPSGITPLMT